MNLETLAAQYREQGYNELMAEARVCQDIVLKAISKGSLNRNVTIKGGVVMRSITGDVRRATRDIDFDFIRYSLSEESIRSFIDKLNCLEGITIRISGSIEELSQQEYRGKRVWVIISDNYSHSFKSKIDLGVHTKTNIEQDEYCFDVCLDNDGASLLINSKEQIFAEKLRALLRFGSFTGRVKDIYDLCYLSGHVDRKKLHKCINEFIMDDPDMFENDLNAVRQRVNRVFSDRDFRRTVENSTRDNWMNINPTAAFQTIQNLLEKMDP